METSIVKNENNMLSIVDVSLFGSESNTDKIITRATNEKLFALKTLTPESLSKIANFMPEINRATNAFGKTQSQYMNNLMTISSFAPYRNLRQILSEIERRRQALKENVFKIKKQFIKMMKKKDELTKLVNENNYEKNKYSITLLQVEIQEIESGITDARLYIEGALQEIFSYEQAYRDIMTANNIPENWDEKDFEEDEERHHITKVFQQAHADIISTGRIGQGNHEYFWQCGINPQSAFNDLVRYITKENESYQKSSEAGVLSKPEDAKEPKLEIDSFVEFLHTMYEKYKGSSRKILEMKGISQSGYYENSIFRDINQRTSV